MGPSSGWSTSAEIPREPQRTPFPWAESLAGDTWDTRRGRSRSEWGAGPPHLQGETSHFKHCLPRASPCMPPFLRLSMFMPVSETHLRTFRFPKIARRCRMFVMK